MSQKPFELDLDAGTHYFCTCNQSKNLPYCDGSHQGTSHQPYIVELKEPRQAAICQCHQSASRPFCDGAHASLA